MTKELFVSSTPHETKVGMVEDDQLAEVYLERENEYTLAGSIYKGRVTRVLPGMQSAFVDIGLERDAFLYVSDFMELENQDDDLEDIPTPRTPEFKEAGQEPAAEAALAAPSGGETQNQPVAEGRQEPREASGSRDQQERGGWRGRRRRRGSRDRAPELSRVSRSSTPEPRHDREEYGPPAGYQPILLPGESISKYRQTTAAPVEKAAGSPEAQSMAIAETFPQDEPLFADSAASREQPVGNESVRDGQFVETEASAYQAEVGSAEWDREQKRRHEMNVAAAFGAGEIISETEEETAGHSTSPELEKSPQASVSSGTIEEEEIDEEEAGLASYVEELEEDAAFDEFEEETHAAGDYAGSQRDIAAAAEVVPFSAEPVSAQAAEVVQAEEEVDESAEAEAELEEAQAEAEALLDAEGRANGTVDARAEVRAPAATAAYTQRARRPSFDRSSPRRRGGSGGGRRFRRNEPQNLPQITDLLKEGQEILVQIAKEPIGKKGARITSHIALPGRFLVYMPTVNHTGVSRKIASEEERQRLKRIIQSERENGHGGFIVRTAAQNADEQELRADIRFLKGLWNEIRTRAENSKPPALIYHDLNVVERILRDQVTSDFSAIWVDT